MVKVDQDLCLGCGMCANMCPDGFEMVDGKAVVKNGNAECVKDTASACPVNAIKL